MSLVHHAIARALPYVPKRLVWQVSRRYIAGEHIRDAYRIIQGLNQAGIKGTLDVLGEDVTTPEQVMGCRDLYLGAIRDIASQGLQTGVSIKLSELGLRFDESLCREVMESLVASAQTKGVFVRIDMEDSSVTQITLDIYRDLRQRYQRVGAVIQACLHRSSNDVAELLQQGLANIRLCKGIYLEPASIAYTAAADINQSYNRLLEQLVEGDAEYVGIATHHPDLVGFAFDLIDQTNLAKSRYEFQMLLGVAESLRAELVARGQPMRVYVPFGEHWFAYSARRLRENPHLAGHILRNLFSRG